MGKEVLFGTDGIRGIANRYPMTPEVALQLGKAVARLYRKGERPQVVVGKDTRLSGYLFENAVTAGLLAAGAKVFLVGPLPTPAVAHITRSFAADVGIMITASHNPASHNGLKLFDSSGFKLPDVQEQEIEQLMMESLGKRGDDGDGEPIGKATRIEDARGRYIEFAKATIGSRSLKGIKLVLDCANGAAYNIAPVIFRELGAEVIALNVHPDGLNINEGCGALHPEALGQKVRELSAHVGVALDGDADRVVMVDEKGQVLDGDHILAIGALELRRQGRLSGSTVVGTNYTNSGLDEALAPAGIKVVRVENGDRYVIDEMRRHGYSLGGEQSGHIIFMDHATTGDGTITALQILSIMQAQGKPLSMLAKILQLWPQRTVSLPVRERLPFDQLPHVQQAIAETERELSGKGRLLVRYSGTEMAVRIMAEAHDAHLLQMAIDRVADAFKGRVA